MTFFYSQAKGDSQKAWDWLLVTYFDDLHSGSHRNMGSLYAGYAFTPEAEDGERFTKSMEREDALKALREEKLGISKDQRVSGDDMLSVSGDLAVIRFDSFVGDRTVSTTGSADYYKEHIGSDVYSLMAYSFATIADSSEVKKVVIDLTLNGGGQVSSCIDGLSFIMDDVTVSSYYTTCHSTQDVIVNGTLPNGRSSSYASDYDIYVMTSYASFSCGNMFPTVAKNAGVKIIGEQSGGGACSILYAFTPDGQSIQISGPNRSSLTTGRESNENGIVPDITLDDSYYYDLEKLSAALPSSN